MHINVVPQPIDSSQVVPTYDNTYNPNHVKANISAQTRGPTSTQ